MVLNLTFLESNPNSDTCLLIQGKSDFSEFAFLPKEYGRHYTDLIVGTVASVFPNHCSLVQPAYKSLDTIVVAQ